jgi:hypothetical protein
MITVRTLAAMWAQSRHNSGRNAVRTRIDSVRAPVKTLPEANCVVFEGVPDVNGNPPCATLSAEIDSSGTAEPRKRRLDALVHPHQHAEEAPVPCV